MIIVLHMLYIRNDLADDEVFTVNPIRRQPPVKQDEGFAANPVRDVKDNLENEASKQLIKHVDE
jgi:hypothetical protein